MAGDNKGAIEACEESLKSDVQQRRAWRVRGLAKIEQKDYTGAIADCNRALEMMPENNAAQYGIRGIAKMKKGAQDENPAMLDDGVADCTAGLKVDMRLPEVWSSRARVHLEKAEFDDAIFDASMALRLNSSHAGDWLVRGAGLVGQRKFAEAVKDLDQAVRIDPHLASTWVSRGEAKIGDGQLDSAIADCDVAIRLQRGNAKAWSVRACVKNRLAWEELKGKASAQGHEAAKPLFADALRDAKEALRRAPRLSTGWSSSAEAKYGLGDYRAAIDDASECLEHEPFPGERARNLCVRGRARLQVADYGRAQEDLAAALSANSLQADLFAASHFLKQAKEFRRARGSWNLPLVHPPDQDRYLKGTRLSASATDLRGLTDVTRPRLTFDEGYSESPSSLSAWSPALSSAGATPAGMRRSVSVGGVRSQC